MKNKLGKSKSTKAVLAEDENAELALLHSKSLEQKIKQEIKQEKKILDEEVKLVRD